jgi:hypothetical protein
LRFAQGGGIGMRPPNERLAGKLVLWEYGYMKTTLEIPDPLFNQVKAKAALEGLKLKDLVTSALGAYLAQPGAGRKPQAKPCPFPIIRGRRKWKMPDLTPEFLSKLEQAEDLERYRKSLGR